MNSNGLGRHKSLTHIKHHAGAVGREDLVHEIPVLTPEYLLPSQWVPVLGPTCLLSRRTAGIGVHIDFLPRWSQSPSLLISGSGSWPQREGLLSPAARQIYRRNFPPVAFIQSRTDAPSIKPDHATWIVTWTVLIQIRFRFIACIQIQSFSGRFIFLYLSTLQRTNFPGSHGSKKHYRLVLFRARSLHSFLYIIFLSWRMQTLQRAWNVWRLNSQISQDGTFVHYRFLYWTFFYLIYLLSLMGIFFPLFVCFDILWQLATTHARDNTRDRDANSSRKNDVTWCDFLQGKHVSLSLSRSLLPQKT